MIGFFHLVTLILFAFTTFVLLVTLLLIRKKKTSLSHSIKQMLAIAVILTFFNIGTLVCQNPIHILLWFGLYSASFSWLCFFLYDFGQKYTLVYKKILGVRIGFVLYCTLETVFFLVNIFYPIEFVLDPVDYYGELFYKMNGQKYFLYMCHLVFTYILVGLTFIETLIAYLRAPKFYKKKFFLILLSFMVPVIINTVYVFTDFPVDPIIFSFAFAGFMVSYFSMFYSPSDVKKNMILKVIDDTSNGVLCFDVDDHVIFVNENLKKYMKIPDEMDPNAFLESYLHKCRKEFPQIETENIVKIKQNVNNEDGTVSFFDITSSKLFDDKGLYIGCYFLVHDITELEIQLNEQRYLANHDRLTGLYNREFFYKKVAEQFQKDPHRDYCIIASDIRNFKLVNDVFGTQAGDKVLKQIGDALTFLAKEGSVYGRFHSDRFVLCMPTERFDEERFQDMANHAVSVDGSEIYHIHLNIGVYRVTNKDIPVSVMCDRAFLALASLKNDYKKIMAFYSDDLREDALKEQNVAQKLEEAMAKDQFSIFLQPQMNLKGEVLGGEALVRWYHPERGLVLPGEFINIFEKTGAIAEMDSFVWRLACIQLKKWAERGIDLHISVNISPKDFYFTDVYKTFVNLVEEFKIDPAKLKLEITETAIMIDLEKQIKLVRDLQNYGFCVEMDDFGSGYSSLNMLKDINVDVLKIDMAFLGKTENMNRSKKILKMIMDMSRELEMPVITEGVETQEQFEFLKGIGCGMFQGNYFSTPISIADFEEKYINKSK